MNVGIEIVRNKGDKLLGFELMKAVDPNTQRAHKLLGVLLQIVTAREDAELAIRVVKGLSPHHFMRSLFIDSIAQSVRSGSDGPVALQLWELTNHGDLHHEEALRMALEAASTSYEPDFLYDVIQVVAKGHSSYPDLIHRLLASFWKRPSQSTFEKSDTPGEAGGLMSWAASKAVVQLHNHQFQYGV